uniref:NB-ARC domain-containing protein n=1 Tax=Mycena chlorophos TaxID=658473 RepID=A0ABQ0LAH8_MYCCL|nr:predicted protein [Mycena chlorophos]
MAVHGGTGGAGGSAKEQGGAGGIGQGPNFQINTQYMVLGQQQTPAGYFFVLPVQLEYDTHMLSDEALPVNINCPPPSKYFEGREEILDQLNKCFEVHTLQEQIVVLLHGLGGVGKTQIALKFLASSSQRFVKIFKVTASSVETIRAGYQSIAKAEQVGGSMNDALTWLQSAKTEWMILFDNADKPELNLGGVLYKSDTHT